MSLAMRILDDLEGGEIQMRHAVNWYGDVKDLMEVILHLHRDKKIHVFKDPGRKMLENWEIKELIRNMDDDEKVPGRIRELNIELIWPRNC